MRSSNQTELFPEPKKKLATPEKQSVSREEALQEARWKLKNAEEALARFLDGQNNSFAGSGQKQEALENEVTFWKTRVHGLEPKQEGSEG